MSIPRPGLVFVPLLLVCLLALAASAQERLTLPQAVATALEKNPALRASEEESAAAAAGVGQARAAWYPRIDFNQGFTRGNNPVYVFGTLLTQRQFTAANFALNSLNQPAPLGNFQTRFEGQFSLFDFGRTWFRVSGAQRIRTASEYQTEQERQDLVLRVVRAYYAVIVARENLEAAREAVRTAESNEQRVQNLAQAGVVVQSDLLSAQVFRGQMKEREIRAENQLQVARMLLGHELGLGPEGVREPTDSLGEPVAPSMSMEEYERAALSERPALRVADLQQQAAATRRKAAQSEFAPRLNLFANFERDAERLGGPSGTNWTAGTRLDVNLFAGGADRYRLAEAQARERQAGDQLEWFRSGVRLEVRQAFLETAAARQRAEVARTTVEQAAESLRILQNRYQAGLATITDLLRAQTARLEARTTHLAALHDWQVARAQLERAAGRLTRESPILHPGGKP